MEELLPNSYLPDPCLPLISEPCLRCEVPISENKVLPTSDNKKDIVSIFPIISLSLLGIRKQ